MRRVFKISLILFIVIFIVSIVGFLYFKNLVVKRVIETSIESEMDLPVNIRELSVSPLGTKLVMKGITIENPRDMTEREMTYIPHLEIILDFTQFLKNGQIRLIYLRVDIDRLNIIQRVDGSSNLKSIGPVEKADSPNDEPMTIDIFDLNINDIYYIRHRENQKSLTKRYSLDVNNIAFKNVDSFEEIVNLIILKILSDTKLAKSLDITVGNMSSNVADIVLLSGQTATDAITGVAKLPFVFFGR